MKSDIERVKIWTGAEWVSVRDLLATNEALTARVKTLEGNNKGLVLQNSLLRQRPDLPVDRIPAAKEVEKILKAMAVMKQIVLEMSGTPPVYLVEQLEAIVDGLDKP